MINWKLVFEHNRKHEIVIQRQIVAHVLKRKLNLTYDEVAKKIGYANHTSLVVAMKRVSTLLDNKRYFEYYSKIEKIVCDLVSRNIELNGELNTGEIEYFRLKEEKNYLRYDTTGMKLAIQEGKERARKRLKNKDLPEFLHRINLSERSNHGLMFNQVFYGLQKSY